MPLITTDDLPTNFPKPDYLTLDNFKRGVITIIDKSRMPKNALVAADNIFLVEDGQPAVRPGVGWFGETMPNGAAIEGFDYFDFDGDIHIVAVAGGNVYRSTNNAQTWDLCTGATLTAGKWVTMNQYSAFLYLTNGVDNIYRYDGSLALTGYTALTTPAAPTAAVSTNLTGTGYTVYYKTAAVNEVGFSAASPAVAVAINAPRSSWDTTSNYVTLTLPTPQATQTRADIYYSEDNINFYYIDSIVSSTATPGVTYKDGGQSPLIPSTTAPIDNTTQGPKVEELVNVGTRMFGVRDPNNRYRIWFTSGQAPFGAFSNAYDGGFLDYQPGGKYYPVAVADYRDGKGQNLATIWCDSADGQGCILQMVLETVTIDNISITVPSAYRLPGSRGTPSPGSVVNVLNDYMFYNGQAFYNLGSRADMMNLLSTDESSGNIRPTVKTISTAAEKKIASVYFDAKVFFSVPYNDNKNNATIIYDTERKAWLPRAFTLGFRKFLRYVATDATGNKVPKLLCLKEGDNRLSEIGESIQGDYGVPFISDLITGLYPTMRNRFEHQFTEEAEFELSGASGKLTVELLGNDRTKGYKTMKSLNVIFSTKLSTTGWDTAAWDTSNWDNTTVTLPATAVDSSTKKYFTVQRELNAVQWRVTTEALDARYVLRTLQTWGTPTEGGKPSGWRVR